jgi:PqqD family protein of HPr-rel-A system
MNRLLHDGRPVRRPDVWLREADSENALCDPSSGAVHFLNPTALAIWNLCDGQTTAMEMIRAICELSGFDEEVVAEDVTRTLDTFERTGVITWKS